MDARRAAPAASLCLLLVVAGCTPQNISPTARQPTTEAPPVQDLADTDEPGATGAPQASADLEPVQRWIEQIERLDDLRSRVARQADEPELTSSEEITYEQSPTRDEPPNQQRAPETPDDVAEPPAVTTIPEAGPEATEAGSVSATDSEGVDESQADVVDSPPSDPQPSTSPVLEGVTARATEWVPPGAAPAGEFTPSVNAPTHAAGQQLTLAEFAEHWLDQPAETSFRAQLDRRLLLVLADKYEEARQPLELVSDEQQQMAAEFVEALIAIREGHGGDPGGEANRALARVEALLESLVPLSDLRIPTLALTRSVRGFGRYETFDPPELPAGRENEFVVYCEVGNFISRPVEAGGYESRFSMRTTVLNRAGDVILEVEDDPISDACRTRRRDCFIPRLVRLPATLSPGEYVVKVTIVDKIAGKVAERRTTFRIVARS
jgi:hypothetical protein